MLDETVGFRLVRLMKAHRNQVAAELATLGLHAGQEILLNQLWKRDGPSQTELVASLGVEPPTVTKTLQRLERQGLVRRAPDLGHRRTTRVYLTEKGRDLREPVEEAWRRAEDRLMRGLDDAERHLLKALLLRMSGNYE